MKNILILFLSIVIWQSTVFGENPRFGDYTVYYGTLHNHSSFSADAKGDPQQAYIYARDSSKLDFLRSPSIVSILLKTNGS